MTAVDRKQVFDTLRLQHARDQRAAVNFRRPPRRGDSRAPSPASAIERLERDSGFSAILRAIEKDLLSRAERRSLKSRWRRERERATPSPSALSGWLERFDDPASPKAVAGMAFIPAVTQELRGLGG